MNELKKETDLLAEENAINKEEFLSEQEAKKQIISNIRQKTLTVLGIIMCVILVPLLLLNIILIIQGFVNPDEVPGIGGYKPMMVLTDSMDPKIKSGDLIIIKEVDPTSLKEGDIITFFDPAGNGHTTVTHRIETRIEDPENGLCFETKGDNNNTADRLYVEDDAVVGIYLFRIPVVANIAMFMQTVPGLILCIFVPLAAFVVYDIIRRRKFDKKQDADKDALLAELEYLRAEKAKLQNKDTQ